MRFGTGVVAAAFVTTAAGAAAAQMASPQVMAGQPNVQAPTTSTGDLIIDQNRPDRILRGLQRPGRPPSPAGPKVQAAKAQFAPFVLHGVVLEGSTLQRANIDATAAPFIGQTVDVAALGVIVRDVAALYKTTDVALYTVSVPDQDFAGGVVHLRAIEGRVGGGAVHVDGRGKATAQIQAQAAKLTTENPLSRSTLERRLSLMRDIPGLEIKADLQRTATPGVVQVAIDAKQKLVDFAVSVTSRGTALLGRTQATAEATFYGLLRGGDMTRFTVAAPTRLRGFRYLAVSHSELIGTEGTTITGGASVIDTHPKGLNLRGRAHAASLQVSQPVIRSYNQQLYLTAGVDALDSRNAVLGQLVSNERTRALRLAANYGRSSSKSNLGANLTVSKGLDDFGARTADRRYSRPDFTKINGQVAYDRALGNRWVARLRAAGQATGDALPASEIFSLGGDTFGRAFESAYLSGDSGYASSAELAWRWLGAPQFFKGTEVYGFADDGKAFINARPGISARSGKIASVGAGVRAALNSKAVVQLEAAKAARDDTVAHRDDWRVTAGFKTLF